jgi:ABC-type branched-subunit amino acid transport system substrate-binding protein
VVDVIRHEIRYGERDSFRTPESSTMQRDVLSGTLHAHNLSISRDDEVLRVNLAWTYGAPMRHPVRGIMSLAVGEWGRVRFNYRTSSGYDAHWVYAQMVANIGWFVQPEPAIFRTTEPNQTYATMAELW